MIFNGLYLNFNSRVNEFGRMRINKMNELIEEDEVKEWGRRENLST
jgi:hypothetical protein